MTSTVLDVTIMLLCVSVTVVALGGAADDPFDDHGAPDADRVGDRLTTETATVTYEAASDDGPGDHARSTVHATLAELLVLSAAADRDADVAGDRTPDRSDDSDPGERFASRVVGTASAAFGPRTRIDARPTAVPSIGTEPPRSATVTTAVVTVPAPSAAAVDADRVRFVIRVW